ncbi:hypothetical protein LTR53_018269, partial [Teratosphaeriaceae sp. CCFEE 6253]
MSAFAKLCFPDGDYYIKELRVTLGRNMDFFNNFTQQQRQRKVMEEYAQEPSRPSQPDDNPQLHPSTSSQSLEGRPARGLPSNFSEQGGIASYAEPAVTASVAETRRARRARKKHLEPSHSSSTTSVIPANLHAQPDNLYDAPALTDAAGNAFVPVHPTEPSDIKKISKEHLVFHYDFDREAWCMRVLGSFAYLNDRPLQRGESAELEHLDRIAVYSLDMLFKLPNDEVADGSPSVGPSKGGFADDRSSALRTTPARRLSSAIGDVEESEED